MITRTEILSFACNQLSHEELLNIWARATVDEQHKIIDEVGKFNDYLDYMNLFVSCRDINPHPIK